MDSSGLGWSEYEDEILKKHLHSHGRSGLWHLLPGRSPGAIDKRAVKLGLRTHRKLDAKVYVRPDPRPVPDQDLKRYRESMPPDDRDITGIIFGDPPSWRSALGQKRSAA